MTTPDDDTVPKKQPRHTVGEDLSALSLHELDERIALLRGEIDRIEGAIGAKRASADVAASFFKK